MRSLTDQDVLEVWEEGLRQHPLERALTLLVRATPDLHPARLATLPLGKVNERLLELHSRAFGEQLEGVASCPRCDSRHEFQADVAALQSSGKATNEPAGSIAFELAGVRVEAHLPTLQDLAAAAQCNGPQEARKELLLRCIHAATLHGEPLPAAELSAELIDRLSRELSHADPGAEILLALDCRACGHHWTLPLDPAEFLWSELSVHATRLLRDIHVLAKTYGWTEPEILRLGPGRRQAYLDMIGSG